MSLAQAGCVLMIAGGIIGLKLLAERGVFAIGVHFFEIISKNVH
jgi:hypothetical protein